MAKKFVRGITDVKTINNQDFDTNNVNDLLSDGQYNYIHRKKGKTEEYHNLTDNIKTISSDNTELLSVTNNNKTTNTATLSPKHDKQKEQVLESTRNTIAINHGENGTDEKTTVDTNPKKVLEHENLLTDYGISKSNSGNNTTLGIEYTKVDDGFDLNDFKTGFIQGTNLVNAPYQNTWFFVEAFTHTGFSVQKATHMGDNIPQFTRYKANGKWSDWKNQVRDKSVIDDLLAQKEQVLESTRNTISIHHGTNGTDEKTTVDTNPQKVLEHENLISDSEYITLDHQTGENKTHIKTESLKQELQQLHETKQDVLTAGEGITIEGQTIGLKTIDNYSGDLNELTDTCLVRPTHNAVNLPAPVNGEGILTVVKIGDTVLQQYHYFNIDNTVYTRAGKYLEAEWRWLEWTGSGPVGS